MLLKESWGVGEPVQKPWIAITDKREMAERLFRFANKAWQLCEDESAEIGGTISMKLNEELDSADRAMKKISRMLEISANPDAARDEDEILELRTDLMANEFKRRSSALALTDIRYFSLRSDVRTVSRMRRPTYFRRPNVFVKEMLNILIGDCRTTAIPPECYEKLTGGSPYSLPVLPRLVKRPKGSFNKALHLWFGQGSTLAEIGRHGIGHSCSVPIVFSIEVDLPYIYAVSQGASPAERNNLVISVTLPWLDEIHDEVGDLNISDEAYERRSDFLSSVKPLLVNTELTGERYALLQRIAEVCRKAEIYFDTRDSTSWFFRSVVKPYWESLERRDVRDAIRRYSETSVEQESTTATS